MCLTYKWERRPVEIMLLIGMIEFINGYLLQISDKRINILQIQKKP